MKISVELKEAMNNYRKQLKSIGIEPNNIQMRLATQLKQKTKTIKNIQKHLKNKNIITYFEIIESNQKHSKYIENP